MYLFLLWIQNANSYWLNMESESFSSKKCCECNLFELTFDIHTYSKNDVEWLLLIRNPRNNENCFHQPRLSSEFERSYGCSWTNIIKWYKNSFILHLLLLWRRKRARIILHGKEGKKVFWYRRWWRNDFYPSSLLLFDRATSRTKRRNEYDIVQDMDEEWLQIWKW